MEWPADWGAPVAAATVHGFFDAQYGAVDVYDGGRNVLFVGCLVVGAAGTPEGALDQLRRAARDGGTVEIMYQGERSRVDARTAILRPHSPAGAS